MDEFERAQLAAGLERWKAEHGDHTRAVILTSSSARGLAPSSDKWTMVAFWTSFPATTPTFKRLLPSLAAEAYDVMFLRADTAPKALDAVQAVVAEFPEHAVHVVADQAQVHELYSAQGEER